MTPPSEPSLTPTRPILRPARLGTRRLTRAHVSLQRSGLGAVARDVLGPLSAAVGEQLAAELKVDARLLDGSFSPRQTLPRTAGFAVVELGGADAVAVLELELPFLIALLGRVAGAPGRLGVVTAFTRIEEAAFGLVSLVALNALRRHGPLDAEFAPRLCAVTTERPDVLARMDVDQPHLSIAVRLEVGGEGGAARLLVPARCIQVVAERFPATDARTPLAPSVGAARIRARLFCGRSPLTDAELATLQSGDVVLFEDLSLSSGTLEGAARLMTPLFELHGHLAPAGFTSHRVSPRGFPPEVSMSQPVPSPEAMPPLPVEVEVELTRVHLPVSELAALRAGSLIPLHVNASQPVVLRVGDRAIARAELVEIEGEVGARVLALLP